VNAPRPFYLAIALACAALLGYGYYLQFVDGLEPCPLCIFQRFAYIGMLVLALAGLVHGPGIRGVHIYSALLAVTALTGAAIAGRQVWLQHLPPDRVPECGPGLDYLLEVFSFTETLAQVFKGSGECALVDWTFLGLSIAEWSLVWFTLLACLALVHCVRGRITGPF